MQNPKNLPHANLTQYRFTGASADPEIEGRLEAILAELYTWFNVEIDLKLDRTFRFLKALRSPHLHLPKVVHVAGTNGKGSTVATLRALLEASGHTVHVYTSPHLVHPTERIRLAGSLISSEALLDLLTECIEINNSEPITFFEFFTCAALLAFSRTPADYLILETGMGGRLDTTNVVPNPVATIITTISYDHVAFLGDTLPKIAAEKAGIMKADVPCIIGYQFPEAIEAGVLDVFQKQSLNLSTEAPLLRFGAEWSTAPESHLMLFRYGDDSILTRKPSLLGNHQLWNAGAALAAFRVIAPDHFTPEILSTALGQIEWPGRLQTLENHAFSRLVPAGWELVIDGGHNDSAGLILAKQIEEWRKDDSKPLHLVVAMVDRKDASAFLRPLLPYVNTITVTEIEDEPSTYKSSVLADLARTLGFAEIHEALNVETAIKDIAARENQTGPVRVLMAGSLFFMGNILAQKR
jgi:dihydrofolate synthase/folylpolyglutamate synthase